MRGQRGILTRIGFSARLLMGTNTKRAALVLAAAATLLAAAPAAVATPVARNDDEYALYGRVFPEPIQSWDYINHGATPGAPSEIADAFRYLEKRHPGYLEFTRVDRELGDPNAVSVGPDGKPPWHAQDTKDGLPFYVAKVTDESVPDKGKAYVLILNAHPAEACGQEGMPRFLEDLLTGARPTRSTSSTQAAGSTTSAWR